MQQIEYTRTVVPARMRSPYWKYFGFPSDNNNKILTRQKIVCILCNTSIAYNKNTSNLRTHLTAKHPEILQKVLLECKLEDGTGLVAVAAKRRGRVKLKKRNCNDSLNIDVSLNNPASIADVAMQPENEIFEHANWTDCIVKKLKHIECKNETTIASNCNNALYCILADMFIRDLTPLSFIKAKGFLNYQHKITGVKADDSTTVRHVRKLLNARYNYAHKLISQNVENISQNNVYSLSMECHENLDNHHILNIYFNYLNSSYTQLLSVLYYSSKINVQTINLASLLENLKLENCSAIVADRGVIVWDFISEFAENQNLYLMDCLYSLLTKCLEYIFNLPLICKGFEDLCNLAESKEIMFSANTPCLRASCYWSRLNFLQFVLENIKENEKGDWWEMQQLIDYLKPLKMALDIVSEETLPLCTITRPIILKLFEEHFTVPIENEPLVIEQVRLILEEHLKDCVLESSYLNEATYFDPRFHCDFIIEKSDIDLKTLKNSICARFQHIMEINYETNLISINCNMQEHEMESHNDNHIKKKITLKSFFNGTARPEENHIAENLLMQNSAHIVLKSNIDIEFEKYEKELPVDLEQNPVLWWSHVPQSLHQNVQYKELKKCALYYLSIPCCVSNLYRLSDLEELYIKLKLRKQLNQYCYIEKNLWYLHYNDEYFKQIKKKSEF